MIYATVASILVSSLVSLGVWYQHMGAFQRLEIAVDNLVQQSEDASFGLAVYQPVQGGTGTSTVSANYLNDCLSVIDDSPLTYSWADCSVSGSGDPYPFTPTTNFGTSTSATGTPIWARNGLFASTTSHLATTTFYGQDDDAFRVIGAGTSHTALFQSVGTGATHASFCNITTGCLTTDGIDIGLRSDANGNSLLLRNRENAGLDVLVNSSVLALSIGANASSTIGGGAQGTGLTIFGGATTTGNLFVIGNSSTTAFSARTAAVGGTGTTSISLLGEVLAPSGSVSDPSLVVGGAAGGPGIYLNGTGILGISDGTAGISWNGTALYPNSDSLRNLGIAVTNRWLTLNAVNASTSAISANTLAVGGTATTSISAAGAVTIPSSLTVQGLTSALTLTDGNGTFAEYAGAGCTNQVVEDISALGASTCVSINNGYWSGTDLSVANGGTGLSTFGGTNTILYTTAADTLASEAAFTYAPTTDLLTVVNASTTRATFGSTAQSLFNASGLLAISSTSPWGALSVEINGTSPSFVVSDQGSTTPAFSVMGNNASGSTKGGYIGIATSTPWARLTVDRDTGSAQNASSSILVTEYTVSTSTNKTLDWRDSNNLVYRHGFSATTINFTGYVAGQRMVLTLCNPGGAPGAITWGTQILWTGGTAPTLTTTAHKCDVLSFYATHATSGLKIFGASTLAF